MISSSIFTAATSHLQATGAAKKDRAACHKEKVRGVHKLGERVGEGISIDSQNAKKMKCNFSSNAWRQDSSPGFLPLPCPPA